MRRRSAQRDHRISKNQEVRPATRAIDRIHRVGHTGVEVRTRRGSKMAARGEAPDADALWIDAPILRVRADHADSALRVLERRGMVIARPEAILQDERGNSPRVQ